MASSHRVHFFHLIWFTKGRKNLLLPKIQDKLYPYIAEDHRFRPAIVYSFFLLEKKKEQVHSKTLCAYRGAIKVTSPACNERPVGLQWNVGLVFKMLFSCGAASVYVIISAQNE